MPIAAVLTLTPSSKAVLPAFLGRAAHAWFLAQINQADPALNRALHVPDVRRPFTVSSLWSPDVKPRQGRLRLPQGARCFLRITVFEDALAACTVERLLPRWRERPVTLSGGTFQVRSIALGSADHPQAATASYAALREAAAETAPLRRMTLRFLSPTVFRISPPPDSAFDTDSYNLPFPLPDLVFGGLLRDWDAFAPASLPASLPSFVRDCVVVSHHHLRTRLVTFGGGRRGRVGGFVGTCGFAVRCEDVKLQQAVEVLARFAPFASVGWRATMGLGQVAYMGEG
jgi:CRISPR-associated endoribonuclease Cas6